MLILYIFVSSENLVIFWMAFNENRRETIFAAFRNPNVQCECRYVMPGDCDSMTLATSPKYNLI